MLDGMAEMDDDHRDEAEKAADEAAEVPEDPAGEHVRRPEGPHADDGAQGAAAHQGRQRRVLHRGRDRRRRAPVTTTFTAKAMDAAEQGVIEAARRASATRSCTSASPASSPAPARSAASTAARTTCSRSSTGRSPAARPARPSSRSRSPPASRTASRSRTPSTATRPYELPDGTDVENQGDERLRHRGQPDQGHRGLDQHRVHRHDAGMDDGPEKIVKMANAMGIPPDEGAQERPGFPNETPGLEPDTGVALGSRRSARSTWPTATRTIANGGVAESPTSSRRSSTPTARRSTSTRSAEASGRSPRTSPPTVATPCSRSSRPAPATRRQALDRPAAGKTGTATNDGGDVVVVVVRRLHPAAGDRGHVRPRQGQRPARRLAAVEFFGGDLPGRDLDRGDAAPRWRA